MDLLSIVDRYRTAFEQRYASSITQAQRHAMDAMQACRSGRYGHVQFDCQPCQLQCTCNHSCGHRFCHRCQHHDTCAWLERQTRKLLPVNYFMVTFTLPKQLRALAFHHQSTTYACLFECAANTLKDFMANDKQLNAQAGLTAVLHTHSRQLNFHPHVHLVVPAGGLNVKRQCWVTKPGKYLFNERALSRVFRARMCQALRRAGFTLPPDIPDKWIADCQFIGKGLPALKYLSRYLYRGVISERNIIVDDGTCVTFRYQCSSTGQWKTRRLSGEAFLRLLFQHVLPKGFRRVRDYGFLHGNARPKLQRIQLLLRVRMSSPENTARPPFLCRLCQQPMRVTAFVKPTFNTG